MKTRQDYLNNKCTHREYYAQFVTEGHKQLLLKRFGAEKIAAHCKSELGERDYIAIEEWDRLAPFVKISLKPFGDYLTLSGQVCILKEAAKQIAEGGE